MIVEELMARLEDYPKDAEVMILFPRNEDGTEFTETEIVDTDCIYRKPGNPDVVFLLYQEDEE